MSAFAQTVTGDLDISTGNLRVVADVGQVTAWKLSNLFDFWKGEWFRDAREGVPYLQYVFVTNPNLAIIADIFKRVIFSAPAVATIDELNLDYTPKARTIAPSFKASLKTGERLTGGVGTPFIIEVKQ